MLYFTHTQVFLVFCFDEKNQNFFVKGPAEIHLLTFQLTHWIKKNINDLHSSCNSSEIRLGNTETYLPINSTGENIKVIVTELTKHIGRLQTTTYFRGFTGDGEIPVCTFSITLRAHYDIASYVGITHFLAKNKITHSHKHKAKLSSRLVDGVRTRWSKG